MKKILFVIITLLPVLLFACAPGEQGQRLRIVNSGNTLITNLRVLFPDQEIVYGDIPPRATTAYKVAPKGVYGYAAYKYDLNGETITQPVIDWVASRPSRQHVYVYD